MIPESGAVLGIDVGWSASRRSAGGCLLEWGARQARFVAEHFRGVEPDRTAAVARLAGGKALAAAAFDGPFRRQLDEIGRYRAAERMLTVSFAPLIGKPGQSNAPVGRMLNRQTNQFVAIVNSLCRVEPAGHQVAVADRALVEAFPGSFMGVMIAEPRSISAQRGDRSDVVFEHLAGAGRFEELLDHCCPGRILATPPAALRNHDQRAAFVCALTALCVAANDYMAVGDDDGWIILPPRSLVQPWALELLDASASVGSTDPMPKRHLSAEPAGNRQEDEASPGQQHLV